LIESAVHSSYPEYHQTVSDWPAIKENKGRIVIYYKDNVNILKETVTTKPLSLRIKFNAESFDKSDRRLIGRNTFVFDDLTAGQNTVLFKQNTVTWRQGEPVSYNIDVISNKTAYYRIVPEVLDGIHPQKVSEEEALNDLQSICHNYKKALPLSLQPSDATSAM
jgi:hypothetical protein